MRMRHQPIRTNLIILRTIVVTVPVHYGDRHWPLIIEKDKLFILLRKVATVSYL
jgi:urease accessory protein UreE